MKKKSLYIIQILINITFLYGFSFSGCYNFANDLRGNIEGRVLLRNTDIPVKDVEIHIESLRDSSFFTIYTNEDGYYYQDDVHFGVNKVEFSKNKYHSLVKYADIRADDTFHLDIEIHIEVPPKNIVTAIVAIDRETGLPVEDVIVDFYKCEGGLWCLRSMFFENDLNETNRGTWYYYATVYTDENGIASADLTSDKLLPYKGFIDLEVRFYAAGYEEKHINYTVFFETRQEIRVVDLAPL